MTAVLDASANAAPDGAAPTQPLASWPARAGALCLDVLVGLGVLAVLVPLVLTAPERGWLWWVYMAVGRRDRPADPGQPVAAANHHRMEPGPGAVRYQGRAAGRRRGGRIRAAAGPRPGPPAGHRGALRRVAVAAVGLPPPHLRRSVAAHRGSPGRSTRAGYAPVRGEGARRRRGGVCGSCGVELSGGLSP